MSSLAYWMKRAEKLKQERDELLKLLGDIYPIAEEEWGHYKIEWNSIGGNLMARIRAAINAAREKDEQA